jgi:mono/diheme cytochrome c family protein
MTGPGVHSTTGLAALLVLAALASGCSGASQGDAVRGEAVHKVCLECHGTNLYVVAERKIKSLAALRREVARWGDYYNPALTEQDIDDVTAYLNTHFYKF